MSKFLRADFGRVLQRIVGFHCGDPHDAVVENAGEDDDVVGSNAEQ